MRKMRTPVFAALAALAVLAGCGSRPPHTPGRGSLPSRPAGATISAQVAACTSPHALEPPCTAIVPEGASGLRARFVEGPLLATLIGGEIQLDTFGGELTAAFENVKKAWYCPEPDPAYGWAIPTRAFGETGGITRGSPCISYATAVRNLGYLMDKDYLPPVRALGVNFSHDQVDALGDLSWNTGPGTICCELARLLRAHAWYAAGVYILRYSYANGEYLPGLHARRERERSLLQVVEPPKPKPVSRAQRVRELRAAEAESKHLQVQRHHLQQKLSKYGCRRLEHEHRRRGPRCRGWEAAGGRVGAAGRRELGRIHVLRKLV